MELKELISTIKKKHVIVFVIVFILMCGAWTFQILPNVQNFLQPLMRLQDFSISNRYDVNTNEYENRTNVYKKFCFPIYLGLKPSLDLWMKTNKDVKFGQNRNDEVNETFNHGAGNKHDQFINESKSCRRYVTILDYQGRIGNQLFKVASLIGTAFRYDVIPVISEAVSLRTYYDLPDIYVPKSSKYDNVVTCVCNKSGVYYNCTQEFNTSKNITLHGYLQSWKYFDDVKDVIRKVFKLKSNYLLKAKEFLDNIKMTGYQLISIHIRRGDITEKHFIDYGYAVADLNFIEKAKRFYINKYSKVQFIVVTNDKAWCRQNVKNVEMSPFENPGYDMALLTLSDHVIVTTGTFGWWGAWLAGGTTVYFNKYPRPGSVLASRMNRDDYYPPDWIGMS